MTRSPADRWSPQPDAKAFWFKLRLTAFPPGHCGCVARHFSLNRPEPGHNRFPLLNSDRCIIAEEGRFC